MAFHWQRTTYVSPRLRLEGNGGQSGWHGSRHRDIWLKSMTWAAPASLNHGKSDKLIMISWDMYKLTSCQEESSQLSKMTKTCSQLHHKKIALMRLKKVGFRRWLVGLKSFLASSFWMNGSCLRGSFWIANYVVLLLSCFELIGVLLKGGLRTWWIRVETTSSLVPFV